MNEKKKRNIKGSVTATEGSSIVAIAPHSHVASCNLGAELSSAGTSRENDIVQQIMGDQFPVDTPEMQEPPAFAHDWSSDEFRLAPSHKHYLGVADFAPHLKYPPACSNPNRREMYYKCVTTELRGWDKHMLSVATLVDKALIKAKRIEHAFDHGDAPVPCDQLTMQAPDSVGLKRERDTPSSEATMQAHMRPLMRTIAKIQPLLAGNAPVDMSTVAIFSKHLQDYEQGEPATDRSLYIGTTQQASIDSLFALAKVDANISRNWRDPSLVPTPVFVDALNKVVSGATFNLSPAERFRQDLENSRFTLRMSAPVETVNQVSAWTERYKLYQFPVWHDEERKNQLLSLERTMRLIGEGPEAKAELAAVFAQLKADKATFLQAIEKLKTLHWDLHTQFTTVRKWFDLSQLPNGSNKRPFTTLEAGKQPAKRAYVAGGDHELGVPTPAFVDALNKVVSGATFNLSDSVRTSKTQDLRCECRHR